MVETMNLASLVAITALSLAQEIMSVISVLVALVSVAQEINLVVVDHGGHSNHLVLAGVDADGVRSRNSCSSSSNSSSIHSIRCGADGAPSRHVGLGAVVVPPGADGARVQE